MSRLGLLLWVGIENHNLEASISHYWVCLFGRVVRTLIQGDSRIRTICMSLLGLTFRVGSESTIFGQRQS